MLLWWPHSEPEAGVDLIVTRAFDAHGKLLEVGERFSYRELGFSFEQARVLCREGFARLERLQMVAVRAFDGYQAGDLIPFLDLNLEPTRILGMVATNLVRLGLDLVVEAPPAPKVGGKVDRSATARQRSARA